MFFYLFILPTVLFFLPLFYFSLESFFHSSQQSSFSLMNWLIEKPSISHVLFSSIKFALATLTAEVNLTWQVCLRIRKGTLSFPLFSKMTKSSGLKPAVAKKIWACLFLCILLGMLSLRRPGQPPMSLVLITDIPLSARICASLCL